MSKWNGKTVLVIGDSIAADGRWQKEFGRLTGANIMTHALGGIGLIDMIMGLGASKNGLRYDPHTNNNGRGLAPLMPDELRCVDLIILGAPYNERDTEYGDPEDMYPEKNTLRGMYNFVINRLYEMLDYVDNLGCHIMLCAPHCSGKYDWVYANGYEEFPEGSGHTLETMAELIKKIAGEYNLPCCDPWHNSGINRYTWKFYTHSPVVMNPDYDPEKEYEAPYPEYADQAHLNSMGYARLGECIACFAELA